MVTDDREGLLSSAGDKRKAGNVRTAQRHPQVHSIARVQVILYTSHLSEFPIFFQDRGVWAQHGQPVALTLRVWIQWRDPLLPYYISLYYVILHDITLHDNTLHYITLHYITLHYITLHYITLHHIILFYIFYYITLHYITIHYMT